MTRNPTSTRPPCVQAAINKAGSVSALASIVEVTPAAIRQWRAIPVHHVRKISEVLQVPLCDLIPTARSVKNKYQAQAGKKHSVSSSTPYVEPV
ncbi:hypothetical protein GOB58_00650 [Acetobacter thailandicus]|nr:hypothetical protein [Acetobacter thailandicus]